MNLAEVSARILRAPPLRLAAAAKEEHYSRWIEHPSSTIVHHERSCCEEARLWFLAYARSMEASLSPQLKLKPPNWLGQLFSWGPSVWPISWCQIPSEKNLDCGVFAALAREVLQTQGFTVHPAQALLGYNASCTDHWKDLWKSGMRKLETGRAGMPFPWVGDQVVYHELCVLEMPEGQAKVYDSTFGYWLEPERRTGFRALLSIRAECPRLLYWGGRTLSFGEWVDL